MKITKEWLEEKGACGTGTQWFLTQKETDGVKLVKTLIDVDWNWANWLIVRLMTYKQYVSYAVFAAEQVIEIYEKKYPEDKRPRNAIEAAKKCIASPTKKNKTAAADAATYAAADATYAAGAAAYAAAAYAEAAADAAADATYATYADAAAKNKMRLQIINYGLELLRKGR